MALTPTPFVRLATARLLARAAGEASRRIGQGGGTTLPGVVARAVDREVARRLSAGLAHSCLLVSGTNGKTTTTRLLSAMLAKDGRRLVHNRAGANLMSGITTALLESAGDTGLFEVDEATLPAAIDELRPKLVLCLNLFRDQLDRYGELNTLGAKWAAALGQLSPESTVPINADDPLVASLAGGLPCRVAFFGLDSPEHALPAMQHAADSLYCPRCAALLSFDAIYYGHLGHYACPTCGFRRPTPTFTATDVRLGLDVPTTLSLRHPVLGMPTAAGSQLASPPTQAAGETAKAGEDDAQADRQAGGIRTGLPDARGSAQLETALPGLYNVYNVLAAAAAGLTLGLAPDVVAASVRDFSGAFGRTETVEIDGKRLRLLLAKNPVGFNEVIRTLLLEREPLRLYLALNDRIADGEDVSWIWDVDFEQLAGRCATALAGGTRAEDLAVRLKYAGFPAAQVRIAGDHAAAIRELLASTPPGAAAYAVPTYTAMLDMRRTLAALGAVRQFWED